VNLCPIRWVEGEAGESEGLGLLPVRTELAMEKVTVLADAGNLALPFLAPGTPIEGYEIHMGRTSLRPGAAPAIRIRDGLGPRPDGCVAPTLPVWGCYLHGIFASDAVCRGLRDWILARKGLPVPSTPEASAPDPFERLADWLESHAPSLPFPGDPQTTQGGGASAKDITWKPDGKD